MFSLTVEQLQLVLNNDQAVQQQYPRQGTRLPVTPSFIELSDKTH
jgi:hypothetical protein